jgi:hypothetical protein
MSIIKDSLIVDLTKEGSEWYFIQVLLKIELILLD